MTALSEPSGNGYGANNVNTYLYSTMTTVIWVVEDEMVRLV